MSNFTQYLVQRQDRDGVLANGEGWRWWQGFVCFRRFGVASFNATAQPVGTRYNSPLKNGSSRVIYDIAFDLLKCLTKFRVLLAAHLGAHATTVRKQVCRSPLYLPFLRRMHLILAGQFVEKECCEFIICRCCADMLCVRRRNLDFHFSR